VTRHEQVKQPRDYLQASPAANRVIAARELPFEFMLNALRLVDGFPLELFAARTGLSFLSIEKNLEESERKGLLERTAQRVRPTRRGRAFLNDLTALFLPAHE
jgi:oxygen-independent coproporphyrinogen-3 oxidase